jgi:hypothetical protein
VVKVLELHDVLEVEEEEVGVGPSTGGSAIME